MAFVLVALVINVASLAIVKSTAAGVAAPVRPATPVTALPVSPAPAPAATTFDQGYVDDGQVCLHWFVHVTDLHFNQVPDSHHHRAYAAFLNYTHAVVHPFTIIVTGDLVNGQRPDNYTDPGTRARAQWQNYFGVVNASPYATDPNPYRYLDVAGNHDRNADLGAALFLNHTLLGRRLGTLQAFFTAEFSTGTTAYAALDSSGPLSAPPIPFCSEGNLDPADLTEYAAFLADHAGAEHKFTFQHHTPLETFGMVPDPASEWIRDEVAFNAKYGVDVVWFGHSHFEFVETWGDVVHAMGDRWRDQYRLGEAEGGVEGMFGEPITEGPDNASATGEQVGYFYHLVAVDGHGVSYANVPFSHLPSIVITNPGNPYFLDGADPVASTRGDGHVRALVFPNASDPVVSVRCQVDGGPWVPMLPYGGAPNLYETPRGTVQDPAPVLPDDDGDHAVRVKVRLASGLEYTRAALATTEPRRKWVWQGVLVWFLVGLAALVTFINRENFPLRRADGRRRRLTHAEKVAMRTRHNARAAKPASLPYLGWAVVLCFLVVPWGVLPLVQGAPAAVYSLFVVTPHETTFLIESLIYSAGRLLLIFPLLYFGTRTYHPEVIVLAALLLFGSAGVMAGAGTRGFGALGWILPGVYVDCVLGGLLFATNVRKTWLARKLWPA